ncbi:glycosyltransferase 87 family protein [Streptomyces sp. NPDC005820]|uniref:glycosyltransferase 87 family protein n=1 Tax=Streptomyces sp. NPDC005820 TaxID=3157069 RepID=UPI0033DAB8B0
MRGDSLYWPACAGFALALATVTTLTAHRVWGACAAVGYAVAAVLTRRTPHHRRRAAALVAAVGAVVLPLAVLMVTGVAQAEVGVVQHSAELLLDTGSPYAPYPRAVHDFNPYLPGMALLGTAHVVLGDFPLADARFWFAAVFFVSLLLAARHPRTGTRTAAGGGALTNALLLIAGFPAVALPLAVGGVDLPVIGLMCLGLSLAGRRHDSRTTSGPVAGLVMGAAAALKWTAWPLLPVALTLLAVTAGRRAAMRAAFTALTVAVLAIVPSALVDPHAFVENVVLFPLGAGGVGSPATSPLPGYLLATYVPGGRAISVAALLLSAVGVGASLIVRPPRTVVAAADRLAMGLGLAMCLMPATRFGYLVYPLLLMVWFRRAHRMT